MSSVKIDPVQGPIRDEISVPSDKSISHRSVMLSAIAEGDSRITNCLDSEDVRSTIAAFTALGVPIKREGDLITVSGSGLYGLTAPKGDIYVGNSGTTMRLLSGILSGQRFSAVLSGDESLSNRPMKRIIEPLRDMGADISGNSGGKAPLTINGRSLRPIDYKTEVASAQVKSCILLAGLYASGITRVTEPAKSRDHTERMLIARGAEIYEDGLSVSVKGRPVLRGLDVTVPGDISSAAFFLAAASIIKNSCLLVKSVGLNPTRTGIIDVLSHMGADITLENIDDTSGEPVGDIRIRQSALRGVVIDKEIIPRLIDELPVLMVCAALAEGRTVMKDCSELRVKETDRVDSMVINLREMGADIRIEGDDVIIYGPCNLRGARVRSFTDHRTAMSCAIAALAADGVTEIEGSECVNISFPEFYTKLSGLKS